MSDRYIVIGCWGERELLTLCPYAHVSICVREMFENSATAVRVVPCEGPEYISIQHYMETNGAPK